MLSPRDAQLIAIGALSPEVACFPVPLFDPITQEGILRDYQIDIFLKVARLMRQGYRRILIVLPTGGGKTVLAGAMMRSARLRVMKSQFIVHRRELIKQTSDSFLRMNIPHGFIASGRPMDFGAEVTLAGIQTLGNRLDRILPPNLAIVDEAHHATAATWARVMSEYQDGFIVGLTATPERLDGKGLGEHFDIMVEGPTVADLIEWGYLSPYRYYAPSRPDTSGIATLGGDFNKAAIAELMDKPTLVGDTVEHYLRLAKGSKGIVFASSREHSRHLAEAFNSNGVRASNIDGAMDDDERQRIDDAFRAGEIEILTNVDLLGEGYDVPDVSYVGLDRPTQSLAKHKQQVGRTLRIFPGKVDGVICDHAGNAFSHGLPDQEVEWSLEGRLARKRNSQESDSEPVRQCLSCYRVSPSYMPICPACLEPFPKKERKLTVEEGELQKLEAEELKRKAAVLRKREERGCRNITEFIALAETRGYENPRAWASMKMKLRQNYRPRI